MFVLWVFSPPALLYEKHIRDIGKEDPERWLKKTPQSDSQMKLVKFSSLTVIERLPEYVLQIFIIKYIHDIDGSTLLRKKKKHFALLSKSKLLEHLLPPIVNCQFSFGGDIFGNAKNSQLIILDFHSLPCLCVLLDPWYLSS